MLSLPYKMQYKSCTQPFSGVPLPFLAVLPGEKKIRHGPPGPARGGSPAEALADSD